MCLCICPAAHCLEFYGVVLVLIIFHTCVWTHLKPWNITTRASIKQRLVLFLVVLSTRILWTVFRTPPLTPLPGSCATDKRRPFLSRPGPQQRRRESRRMESSVCCVVCAVLLPSAAFHQISSFHWPEDYWYLTSRELECFILIPMVLVLTYEHEIKDH